MRCSWRLRIVRCERSAAILRVGETSVCVMARRPVPFLYSQMQYCISRLAWTVKSCCTLAATSSRFCLVTVKWFPVHKCSYRLSDWYLLRQSISPAGISSLLVAQVHMSSRHFMAVLGLAWVWTKPYSLGLFTIVYVFPTHLAKRSVPPTIHADMVPGLPSIQYWCVGHNRH